MVVTLAVAAAMVGRSEAIRAGSDRLSDIAITLSDRLDNAVRARVVSLQQLAALEPLRFVWSGSPEALGRLIQDARKAFTEAAWMGFALPDGTVVAATDGVLEGQSVAKQGWFRLGLAGPGVIDSTVGGSNALQAQFPGGDDHFVDIGVPVRNSYGDVIGVLGMFVSRAWVDNLRTAIVGDVNADLAIQVELLNRSGSPVLPAPDEAFDFTADEVGRMFRAGSGMTPNVDEDGYLTAFAVASAQGGTRYPSWLIIARQNAAIPLQAANQVVTTIVALGALVAALGVILAAMIATGLARPFGELADKAALIGRSDQTMLPRVHGSYEAVHLSSVLRALVMRLTHVERVNAEVEGRAAEAERHFNRDIARLRDLANIDPLTEMLNRRAFMEFAREAMEMYRRQRRPFAILMIDIDHFKPINDALGHTSGDLVIRAVARAVTGALRPTDRGGRFGGEEFIVLLQDVAGTEPFDVGERIRDCVASLPVPVGAKGELFVTVSLGIAICDARDAGIDDVIERADTALYVAKRDGRNRSRMAETPVRRIA